MFEVRNEAEDRAEILIYDLIGESTDWWTGEKSGVSATAFKEALDEVSPKPLDLRIDSSGGDVFDAFAICSAIQNYPAQVTAYVDGIAASAASYVAVVCDEVVMRDYAYLMIHCASSYACGNARSLEDTAARLRNIDANLAAIYAKRSNLDVETVIDYMADETWFTASEAHEVGLCTEVAETEERVTALLDPRAVNGFRHVPEGIGVMSERPVESHARRTVSPQDVERASHEVIDGRIYRREAK